MPQEEEARCRRCGAKFTARRYWDAKRRTWSRKASWCPPCFNEYNRIRRAGGTPPPSPRDHDSCVICGDDLPENARGHAKYCSPECRNAGARLAERRAYLVRTYGITWQEYDALLAKQGGGCAICGGPPGERYSLHVDHDHACCSGSRSCGACIRGLLCHGCNSGLGSFRDDRARLEAAVAYLQDQEATRSGALGFPA
ncbi:endonuclease VII domain-containing protein [Trujillonella humicola]|uniref:endonuclease VII domain-containing protein n=1 Tax=Trujillonella humicola TaxID=3383699 RepID=UPI00390662FA